MAPSEKYRRDAITLRHGGVIYDFVLSPLDGAVSHVFGTSLMLKSFWGLIIIKTGAF